MSDLKLDLEHPAIQEMIARRSDGNPAYVAGVRAYLMQGDQPLDMVAYRGYRDANDMTAYLGALRADLCADLLDEESRLFLLRKETVRETTSVLQKSAEASTRVASAKPNQGHCIRI